jgi:thiol-disulfide isomerase/thioredoxin
MFHVVVVTGRRSLARSDVIMLELASMKNTTLTFKNDALTIHMDTVEKAGKTIWHGDFIANYPNGQQAMVGSYMHGKPHGTWRRWYDNGNLGSVHRYVLGTLDGSYTQFYENGDKAREGMFKHGIPEGDHRIYFKGDKLHKAIRYKQGQLLRVEGLIGGRWTVNDLENMIFRIEGREFRYRKVCELSDDGELVCKTPAQIMEDLSTMLPPEIVSQILEELDKLYEEYGLEPSKTTLVQCAGTVLAMEEDTSGDPTVFPIEEDTSGASTAQPIEDSELNRAPMTQQEVEDLVDACREASWRSKGIDSRLPDFDQQREDFVQNTVSAMDESVSSCRDTGNDMIAALPIAGAWAACAAAPIACAALATATASLGVNVYTAYRTWKDDPYTPPVDPNADPKVSYLKGNSSVRKSEYDDGTVVIEQPASADWPAGTKIVETKRGDQTTIKFIDAQGHVLRTIYISDNGTIRTEEVVDSPPPADKATNSPPSDTASGGTRPNPGIPNTDNPISRCEQLQMRWAQLKADCEQSNWLTYECEQVLRTIHHCVDLAEIYPTPDGGMACAQPSNWTLAQSREEACRRRGMIELPSGYGTDSCQPFGNISLPEQDICLDPAAMCRPDALLTAELRDGSPGLERREFRGQPASLPQRSTAAAYAVVPHEELTMLDDDRFFEAIGASDVPQVVVFGAKTCPPCERVKRNLRGIEFEIGRKLEICYVEVPQNPGLAAEFDIRFTPTLIVFQSGRVLGQRRVGAATREMLARYINRSLSVGEVQKEESQVA